MLFPLLPSPYELNSKFHPLYMAALNVLRRFDELTLGLHRSFKSILAVAVLMRASSADEADHSSLRHKTFTSRCYFIHSAVRFPLKLWSDLSDTGT